LEPTPRARLDGTKAVDVPTAAAILGIGRSAAYELIRAGLWPTPTLRLGKLIRIPTTLLLALIEVER